MAHGIRTDATVSRVIQRQGQRETESNVQLIKPGRDVELTVGAPK